MNILAIINPENVAERDVVDWRTDGELTDGFEAMWVEPTQALSLLTHGQTDDYEGIFIKKRDACFMKTAMQLPLPSRS